MAEGFKVGSLFYELELKFDKLKKQMSGAEQDAASAGEKAGVSFGQRFTRALAAAGLGYALKKFFESSIKAAMEEQKAQAGLAAQLGYTSRALLDQASALQKVTTFGDESIVKVQSFIAAFTKEEDQIKELTKATLDLAAAKGMDLVGASDLVAKSFGSSSNALSRYGIEVEGAVGSSERLEQVTRGISELYGGMAEATARTFAGRMEQLKNRIGDLQEKIGYALLPTLEKLGEAFASTVEEGEKADDFFKGVAVAGRIVGSVFLVVQSVLKHIGTLLGTIGASLVALFTGNFAIIPGIVENGFKKITGNAEDMFTGLGNMWKNLDEEIEKSNSRKNARIIEDDLEAADKKRELEAKLYEDLKWKATDYYEHKIREIKRERDEMIKAGMDRVNIERWTLEKIKELNEEFRKAFNPKSKPAENPSVKPPKSIPGGVDVPGKPELVSETNEELAAQLILIKSLEDGYDSALSNMISFGVQSIQVFERVNSLLEAFIDSLIKAVIQTAALAAANFLTGGVSGLLSFVGLQSGGTVTNSGGSVSVSRGIPKFAGGGSFTVPPGFPNDSFPILVQSGERVSVTPVGSSNFSDRTIVSKLNELIQVTGALARSGNRSSGSPQIVKLYLDSKEIAESVTRRQNEFDKGNVRFNR